MVCFLSQKCVVEIFLAFQFVFEEMILSLYRNGFLFSFLMIGLVLADSNPDSCERDKCDVSHFVSDVSLAKGMHVFCLERLSRNSFHITFFKNGYHGDQGNQVIYAADWELLREELENALEIPYERQDKQNTFEENPRSLQPWGLFTSKGERVEIFDQIFEHTVFIVFEGGQFMWPGIHVGFRREIDVFEMGKDIFMETLSLEPLIFEISNFFDDNTLDFLVSESEGKMEQSPVAKKDGDGGKDVTEWRTSTTCMLETERYPQLMKLDQQFASLLHIPVSHQERTQILRYNQFQKYDSHTDYFDVRHYQNNVDLVENMLHGGTKNRLATLFWYMSDVSAGGSTWFPRSDGLPNPGQPGGAKSHASCNPDEGLHSYPRRGKLILFYSLYPNGDNNEYSLHGGCPPLNEGDVKWGANKWIWNKENPWQ